MPVMGNESGIALVTTLGVVAVLLVAATQIGRLTGDAALQTRAENDLFSAGEQAMSGIHLGMLVLSRDAADNTTDSVQEVWSDPDKLSEMVAALGFKTGSMTLAISDEMGKIQLNAQLREFPGSEANAGQQEILARFFNLARKSQGDDDVEDGRELVNAVKDWLDTNDDDAVTGLSGAESDYYQSLENSYPCANGPFNQVSELYNVKGMERENPDLELGNFFTAYGLADIKNDLGRFTYTGKININTAPIEVVAALLPEGRDHLAEDLVAFREHRASDEEQYSNLLEPGWFDKVIELSGNEKTAFTSNITYASHVFRITCKVRQEGVSASVSAVVKREKSKQSGKWACRILQMEQG